MCGVSAKYVCHEKCNVVMSVHPSDTSAIATATTTTTTNNDNERHIDETFVVESPMFSTSSSLERGSIPIDLIDPSSFPALMSTRDVDDDKRQRRQHRSNNVNGSAHILGNQPHVPPICPMTDPMAANKDDDDNNGDACKHERRYNNDDDVISDDDDDVRKHAHPSSYVGSLGPGRTSLCGAGEGQGFRSAPGAAAPQPRA